MPTIAPTKCSPFASTRASVRPGIRRTPLCCTRTTPTASRLLTHLDQLPDAELEPRPRTSQDGHPARRVPARFADPRRAESGFADRCIIPARDTEDDWLLQAAEKNGLRPRRRRGLTRGSGGTQWDPSVRPAGVMREVRQISSPIGNHDRQDLKTDKSETRSISQNYKTENVIRYLELRERDPRSQQRRYPGLVTTLRHI